MTEINKHFLALGLDPSATPAQVKEARLWYTKAFHPDRFPKNSTDQKKAEEKQKEINLAFEQITDWFAKGGSPTKHKQSPTQAKKVITFIEQLDEYVSFMANSERAYRTIENICCDLQSFVLWLERHSSAKRVDDNITPLAITYSDSLAESGYKPLTIARHIHSIRGWLIFCKVDAAFALELAAQFKASSTPQLKSLTETQTAKLLASAKRHAKNQDRLVVEFLLYTGLTASEMCELNWSDVTVKKIPGSKNKTVVLEVAGRSGFRDIPASAKAVSVLEELGMKAYLAAGKKAINVPVFEANGMALTPKMVHYCVTQCGATASVNATPSSLRNTFALKLASSKASRSHLAHYLGISEQSAGAYYPKNQVQFKDLVEISNKA